MRRLVCAPPLAIACAIACATSGVARADDATPDDVVVRGGASAGGFVSRARIEDAPREITDAASLLEPMPGVHVRRLGADDSFATLSVRGTSSTQVAVFLAGVPLTGGADPTLDLATLPLWPGAQARVYRSFAPSSLGRGSLGGTLVLEPPSPRTRPRTEVWTAMGSFGSRRLRVGDVRGDEDGLRIATGLTASRSDDDFTYLDPLATAERGRDVYAARRNAGHAAVSGLASVGLPVRIGATAAGALTITALAQGRRQELPGPLNVLTPTQRLTSSRLVSAVELTLGAGGGTFGVRGWGRREGLAVDDADEVARLGLGPSRTDDAIVAAGGSAGWKARGGERSSVELRVDGSAERFAPGTWAGAVGPPSARRTNGGVALDGELRPLAARALVLVASARGDLWHDASDDGAARTTARPTGHLGAELTVGPAVLASHAGVLARPASFVERFGNRGAFLGEPALRPESAVTVDVGGRIAGRPTRDVRVSLEAAAFASWADDLIVFQNRGAYGLAKATNVGEARLAGVETELRASAHGLDARLSHTALATANASQCRFTLAGCERPPLPGRPRHDLVVDVGYTLGPVRLRYGIDVVTGITTDLTGSITVPDRALHSAGARLAVPGVEGLTASFDLRNLFDLRVVEYAGVDVGAGARSFRAPVGDVFQYPLPGRRFLIGIRYVPPAAPPR